MTELRYPHWRTRAVEVEPGRYAVMTGATTLLAQFLVDPGSWRIVSAQVFPAAGRATLDDLLCQIEEGWDTIDTREEGEEA